MLNVSIPKVWLPIKLAAALLLIPLFLWESNLQVAPIEAVPVFSQAAGRYAEDKLLRLAVPRGIEAEVLFTLDGRLPLPQTATVYERPIFLNGRQPNVTVVRARLLWPDGTLGTVVNASYVMGLPTGLSIASLVADPTDLWDEVGGIYANPEQRGRAWERPIHLTYFDEKGQVGFAEAAGLRIHGNFSRSYNKKSFRLYFRGEYGLTRLNYPLFGGSELQSFNQLVLHAGGQDTSQIPTNWTLMRNQLMANLAFKTAAWATYSQPTLLFINGEPWGLYYFRERIDEVFLQDSLGVVAATIVDSPARRAERVGEDEPGLVAWDLLTTFVAEQDMGERANYQFVQTQIDVDNYMDYSILQIYSANFDWPVSNVLQFRPGVIGGKWQWLMWDSDFSLGLQSWSDVTMNTLAQALDPEYGAGTNLDINERDTILLRGLLANPIFRARFLARTSELLNTTLSPEALIADIDVLAAHIRPGIAVEQGRWQGEVDVTEWEASVEQLRDFARQRPDMMRQQFVESLGLAGMAQVVFLPSAAGQGYVMVDQTPVEGLPWQAVYLAESEVRLTAVAQPGYQFVSWELPIQTVANPLVLTVTEALSVQARFVAVESP